VNSLLVEQLCFQSTIVLMHNQPTNSYAAFDESDNEKSKFLLNASDTGQ
jgi:hypothetical protein